MNARYPCAECSDPIRSKLCRVIYEYAASGVTADKPESWLVLHRDTMPWEPVPKKHYRFCVTKFNMEHLGPFNMLEMTIAEYEACRSSQVPRRVQERISRTAQKRC